MSRNELPVIADLREVFTEAEICPGHKIFEVVYAVVDPLLSSFRASRTLVVNKELKCDFMAKVILCSCGCVYIPCFVDGIFVNNLEFECYPPERVHALIYNTWLNNVVIATLKHSEKVRFGLGKSKAMQPSLACDRRDKRNEMIAGD
mgnify:CR=1 FL=1